MSATDDSFVAFVSTRSNDLQRVARQLTGNADDAVELTQAVLERAYRSWSRIQGR